MNTDSAKFITIEGIEGAGKSTALKFIQTFLNKTGIKAVYTREPGGTQLAESIRKLLLATNVEEKVQPSTELLLMYAARCQHLHNFILPNLNQGNWVISDRFIDASMAYQGGGRGMPASMIEQLNHLFVMPYYPNLTLLMDVSPEVGLLRARTRETTIDRIEQETIDFFVRVRNTYLELAKKEPNRIRIVDANLELPQVIEQIETYLQNFLNF